jgi:hypothetical protein
MGSHLPLQWGAAPPLATDTTMYVSVEYPCSGASRTHRWPRIRTRAYYVVGTREGYYVLLTSESRANPQYWTEELNVRPVSTRRRARFVSFLFLFFHIRQAETVALASAINLGSMPGYLQILVSRPEACTFG